MRDEVALDGVNDVNAQWWRNEAGDTVHRAECRFAAELCIRVGLNALMN